MLERCGAGARLRCDRGTHARPARHVDAVRSGRARDQQQIQQAPRFVVAELRTRRELFRRERVLAQTFGSTRLGSANAEPLRIGAGGEPQRARRDSDRAPSHHRIAHVRAQRFSDERERIDRALNDARRIAEQVAVPERVRTRPRARTTRATRLAAQCRAALVAPRRRGRFETALWFRNRRDRSPASRSGSRDVDRARDARTGSCPNRPARSAVLGQRCSSNVSARAVPHPRARSLASINPYETPTVNGCTSASHFVLTVTDHSCPCAPAVRSHATLAGSFS